MVLDVSFCPVDASEVSAEQAFPLGLAPWFGGSGAHYALIDAGRLDAVAAESDVSAFANGLRCQSLFRDPDLSAVSPWLIELPRKDERATEFIETFFARLYGERVGILLRTDASFDRLMSHLRTFTMVNVEDRPNQVYFRYWDPLVASTYFPGIAHRDERTHRMFWTADSQSVSILVEENDIAAHMLNPTSAPPVQAARPAVVLDAHDQGLLEEVMFKALALSLSDWFRIAFEDGVGNLPRPQRLAAATHVVEHGRALGFALKDEYTYLAHIMAYFGGWFMEIEATPVFANILREDAQKHRHTALEAVFDQTWSSSPQAGLWENIGSIAAELYEVPGSDMIPPDVLKSIGNKHLSHCMDSVRAVVNGALPKARAESLSAHAESQHVFLSLILGHRYYDDPFQPWAGQPFDTARAAAWSQLFS